MKTTCVCSIQRKFLVDETLAARGPPHRRKCAYTFETLRATLHTKRATLNIITAECACVCNFYAAANCARQQTKGAEILVGIVRERARRTFTHNMLANSKNAPSSQFLFVFRLSLFREYSTTKRRETERESTKQSVIAAQFGAALFPFKITQLNSQFFILICVA